MVVIFHCHYSVGCALSTRSTEIRNSNIINFLVFWFFCDCDMIRMFRHTAVCFCAHVSDITINPYRFMIWNSWTVLLCPFNFLISQFYYVHISSLLYNLKFTSILFLSSFQQMLLLFPCKAYKSHVPS